MSPRSLNYMKTLLGTFIDCCAQPMLNNIPKSIFKKIAPNPRQSTRPQRPQNSRLVNILFRNQPENHILAERVKFGQIIFRHHVLISPSSVTRKMIWNHTIYWVFENTSNVQLIALIKIIKTD